MDEPEAAPSKETRTSFIPYNINIKVDWLQKPPLESAIKSDQASPFPHVTLLVGKHEEGKYA